MYKNIYVQIHTTEEARGRRGARGEAGPEGGEWDGTSDPSEDGALACCLCHL